MVDDPEKIKVLFIGGWGRSGSTILERMLGQLNGFFPVGEIYHIWERGFNQNQLCSCRSPFRQCAFWNAVIEESFGSLQRVDAGELLSLQRSTTRLRYLPRLTFSRFRSGHYEKQLKKYIQLISQLYGAIKKVSGCKVIVDSSKEPAHGFILNATPTIQLHVVHLIRDSRAVAYSWQRKRPRPEIHWKNEYMPRYSPLHSAIEWNIRNLTVESLRHCCQGGVRESYENLVKSPQRTIRNVLSKNNFLKEDYSFVRDSLAMLDTCHTVSGNPNRFQTGEIKIYADTEWRERMKAGPYFTITALTWPLLVVYGYSLNRAHP